MFLNSKITRSYYTSQSCHDGFDNLLALAIIADMESSSISMKTVDNEITNGTLDN